MWNNLHAYPAGRSENDRATHALICSSLTPAVWLSWRGLNMQKDAGAPPLGIYGRAECSCPSKMQTGMLMAALFIQAPNTDAHSGRMSALVEVYSQNRILYSSEWMVHDDMAAWRNLRNLTLSGKKKSKLWFHVFKEQKQA